MTVATAIETTPALREGAPRAVYAGLGRRGWAALVDVLLAVLVSMVIGAATGGESVGGLTALAVLINLVGLTAEGGTLGQRVLGLRVVRASGEHPGLARAILRQLVVLPLSIAALGLGLLWMLDERQRRMWHDIAADTIVVHELRPLTGPAWATSPPWARAPGSESGREAQRDRPVDQGPAGLDERGVGDADQPFGAP